MNIKKPVYVGIDFGNEYSQVSYYSDKEKEPVSLGLSGPENGYYIPTVISKAVGKSQWFAGDEAKNSTMLMDTVIVDNLVMKAMDRNPVMVDDESYMPAELISIFLNEIVQAVKIAAGVQDIAKICITLDNFKISLLNVLSEALNRLNIPKDDIIFSSHTESFVYYAMNQKQELWTNDVALFDYGDNGLVYKLMSIIPFRGQNLIMTKDEDFSSEVPYSLSENKTACEYLDGKLSEIASGLFFKRTISSVYLTGKGFGDSFNAPDFFKVICDRKRAFSGQNLYVKGACYQAVGTMEGSMLKNYVLCCNERITTGIELKIIERGKEKILRLVKPGVNWYGADCSFNLIVDEAKELEMFLSPVDTVEKQLVKIPLTDFPERPRKTTLINFKISFTSDKRCYVMVIDKGFGEFFPGSGRIINEEIML